MHVIGTAGHVDHGKSTLVQALTGIDPDRLVEEKEREMTIDLGFAWITLDGEEIGVVDVPGHRDFIENMLAGVGGIDLALFVIAADEGVMPQTREHLAILDLLGVRRGIVVLTKIDLLDDPDWLDLIILEAGEILHGTVLANAPILPVSARSGMGLDRLKDEISKSLHEIEARPDLDRPRLPIDRIFSLPGFGTVVTGTLIDGSFQIGDEVEVQPGAIQGRVRGLQTHKLKRDIALPGSRVAMNLTGLERSALWRGQVVTKRGQLRNTQLLDTSYHHLPDADAPLLHNAEVKLFTGSTEAVARARIIGGDLVNAGEEGWVQFVLGEPIAVLRGDRFIIRRPSPGATLGGGIVLDPHPGRRHRRYKPEVVERFQSNAQDTPAELLLRTLARLGSVQPKTLFEKVGLNEDKGWTDLQQLIDEGHVVRIGKLVIASASWRALMDKVPVELANHHQAVPMRSGLDREELRSRLQIPQQMFTYLCESLVGEGKVVEEGTLLRLPDHQVKFSAEEENLIGQLMATFETQGVQSPSVKECKTAVGETVYFALIDQRKVISIADDVVYSATVYDGLIQRMTAYLEQHGSITPAEARDLLDTSRKYAIALLEHMDELRITRRSGDIRLPAKPLTK